MSDLFNNAWDNTSNNYIQPNLAPCPDAGDSFSFEFLSKKDVGVINGSKTVASLSFSDYSQDITGWSQDKKIIEAGEVIFIPGLTKGITSEQEVFPFYFSVSSSSNYYMSADISISFYKNFKYVTYDVSVQPDVSLGIDIENAINTGLAAVGANVSVDYNDASIFTFSGGTGYAFDVTALRITRTDTSTAYNLAKAESLSTPAFKYPNGAMLGYMLRTLFPTSVTEDSDKWLYINHVPTQLKVIDPSGNIYFNKYVDVGMNGNSTSSTMSAGDYLNYIDTNSLWDKVGSFKAWMGTVDPDNSNVTNLVKGFYLYNPHDFPIQIDYILVN